MPKPDPSFIDAAKREKLLTAIAAGVSLNTACGFAGITVADLREHAKRDPMIVRHIAQKRAEVVMFYAMKARTTEDASERKSCLEMVRQLEAKKLGSDLTT